MKDKIIKESLHRFSIDGYYNTSMQSIAQNCGISKASLYKYFASKEDLLLQAFEYNLEQMLLRATTLQVDPQKSPREQLIEKIVSELESTKEHRPFMHLVLRTAPPKKNAELMSMFKRTRALLMNWHYDSLEQMYKGNYRGNLWDLVVMFQGTLREYTSLMVDEHKSLNSHDVAHKVVEFVEAAAPVQFTNQALLSEEMMNDYATYRFDEDFEGIEAHKRTLCWHIQDTVEREASAKDRSKLIDAAAKLTEEATHDNPRQFMIESLGRYLADSVSISSELHTLQQLIAAQHAHFQE
ncbi:TetR/AcrR family transcriptional regulator [Geomicrobium sp. JCM 19039]|uniref:TetR/AcrR family transcriptional regulator n=1 Tax=Geomicrobium sp. JCM 19039 TaxID=1460636 RepID=UPI00045F4080|nr:TetR/AcrR family transcriptional regulator [Geomicrobium sp. JCM 19039]GAK13396.1 TetR family transcriptional regulator [Geomicrobium sp. JCM 19039]